MKLQGQNITLRAMEPSDIDVLYQWENDTDNWTVSNTQTPFSRFVLEQYITSAHEDIYTVKQLRLMVDLTPSPSPQGEGSRSIGTIDLFDFDPNNLRAGIGILIAGEKDRRKGHASEALNLLTAYCFGTLNLHQLFCNITSDNKASINLFQQHDFEIIGNKKQWVRDGLLFKDELLLQRIR